jgi:hypothetical protein
VSKDAARAYCRFVEVGLADPTPSPFRETCGGRALGSQRLVERLRTLAGSSASDPPLREARQLARLEAATELKAVAAYYQLECHALTRRLSRGDGRNNVALAGQIFAKRAVRGGIRVMGRPRSIAPYAAIAPIAGTTDAR